MWESHQPKQLLIYVHSRNNNLRQRPVDSKEGAGSAFFLEDAAVPLSRLFFAISAYCLFLAVTSAVLTLAAGCRSCFWTLVHAIYVYHQAQWLACVGNPFVKNKKIFSNFLFVSCNTSILGACSSRFYELEESPARANLPLPALDVMGWLTG